MQNNQTPTGQSPSFKNGWSEHDRAKIASVFIPLVESQRLYGRDINAKSVLKTWEWLMAEDFTADQVCHAMKKHLTESSNFPTPAEIIAILRPQPKRISESEFIAAQDWQKRNGYPMFSDALDVIEQYKKQEKSARSEQTTENLDVLQIAKSAIKGVGHERN